MTVPPLGWVGIVRLGLVQTALGAIVVLTTSTLNRVMVVELALPAILPGVLVALHYLIQVMRPRLGYGLSCLNNDSRFLPLTLPDKNATVNPNGRIKWRR